MSTPGIPHFHYTRTIPPRSVGIAQVVATPATPEDLVDIDNLVLTTARGPGALTVAPYPTGAVVNAYSLNNSVEVSGFLTYLLENQFFEITYLSDASGNPLYYQHPFELLNVNNVAVFDLDGNAVTGFLVQDNTLFHSFDGSPYWVRYYADGILRTDLLRYQPAMARTTAPTATSYSLTAGGLLALSSTGSYWLRFTATNAWQLLPPYNVPSNDPWYPRVRFNLRPVPLEWSRQPFTPCTPYLMASWVPGKVLASNLVEFERHPTYFDGVNYPDILVYDKNWNLKYALDGSDSAANIDKGYLFPWMRSQFINIDAAHARCQVAVALASDDQPFAFYNYAEKDVVFRDLDINPFTRPQMKDTLIQFYYAERGADVPPRTPENIYE